MDSRRFEKDMPFYVYASDLVRRCLQALSGSIEMIRSNHEGSGKEGGIKVVRCRGDLSHF